MAFGVTGSLMNIIISKQITASKGDYAIKQSEKLDILYGNNKKELAETYEENWYKNNFRFIDQKTQLINQAVQQESDFVGKIGMINGANDLAGGSYLRDTKNALENKKDENLSTLNFNKDQQDKNSVEQYNIATQKLADNLVEQNEALSDNYKQVREQDKANTFAQLIDAGSYVGEYYVDSYYTKKDAKKKETAISKITIGGE